MKIILASASQRRENLLQSLGLDFTVIPSNINEKALEKKIKDPYKLVVEIALAKAKKVEKQIVEKQTKEKDFLIISADTFGVLANKVICKPKNRQEAKQMLKLLSNKTHQILTGIALLKNIKNKQKKIQTRLVIAEVVFKNLSDQKIEDYLDTEVYLDRAGAYGIQDPKCDFVKEYKGSYTNILGLPLKELTKCLKEFGVRIKKKGGENNGNK